MAVSCVDPSRRRPLRPALVLPALLAVAGPLALADAGPPREDLSIDVEARTTVIDLKENTAILGAVIIREGDVRVEAREATAKGGVDNFENNQWVLTGDVRIVMPGGGLEADRAVVSFVDNRIVRAVITGSPSEFEQKIEESGDLARGHARTIEYDVVGGTVRLEGDAYITDGRNDIRGSALVYDINSQRVVNEGEDRVRITINPTAVQEQRDRQQEEAQKQLKQEQEQRQPEGGKMPEPGSPPEQATTPPEQTAQRESAAR
jgi:lipopolysaccharide transport protein LptA